MLKTLNAASALARLELQKTIQTTDAPEILNNASVSSPLSPFPRAYKLRFSDCPWTPSPPLAWIHYA
jgi:hypothetical protein